ncbi:MAG TPA: cyclase family protein [Phycisphaerae bacterium]|nr:cyclase family protein [Phycisphaerae bacterium]
MRLIDLSQPLFDACPNCPAHPGVKIEVVASHARDGAEGWHLEHLSFTSHTGSHVDAPLHKIQSGRSLDDIPLERWTGPAYIVDLRGIGANTAITVEMLMSRLPKGAPLADHWVLLATGFGDKRAATREWLHEAPVLSHEAARWLVERQVRGVGIDHWSIGDAATHATLLGAAAPAPPVLIVEELHFPEEVFALAPPVSFAALPMNLRGHSGGPCRPVLILP